MRVFRIADTNSNLDRIEVFGQREGLEQIFDYTQWLSTKRYQHRITAGSLGDYLKRHGGMGYASWNNLARNGIGDNDGDSDDDNIQWEEPLIFRFNGCEYTVFIYYDRYRGLPESVIKYAGKSDAIDYTEVECSLDQYPKLTVMATIAIHNHRLTNYTRTILVIKFQKQTLSFLSICNMMNGISLRRMINNKEDDPTTTIFLFR